MDPQGVQGDPPMRSGRPDAVFPVAGDCPDERLRRPVVHDPEPPQDIEHGEMQAIRVTRHEMLSIGEFDAWNALGCP